MRILHLMLSCFYIDNANYQENALAKQNKEDGHDVRIIASTEIFVKKNQLGYTEPNSYISENGIPVIRLPYIEVINHYISSKIRKYVGLKEKIESFVPDVIFFHGLASYDIITVANYKKEHPNVYLVVDSHEDYNNSGRNFLSKYVLHRFMYRLFIKIALPYINKIFYITEEARIYIENEYGLKGDKLIYYPLGGYILTDEKYLYFRRKIRKELSLKDSDIVLMHSGKMDKGKRTLDILSAFKSNNKNNLKLLIVGSLSDDISDKVFQYIDTDCRVLFLGWKSGEELTTYLCASDLYIQPGGQSATMQHALCARCGVALYPHLSHITLLGNNAFYIESIESIIELLDIISVNPNLLMQKRKLSFQVAQNKLNYEKIAKLIYE